MLLKILALATCVAAAPTDPVDFRADVMITLYEAHVKEWCTSDYTACVADPDCKVRMEIALQDFYEGSGTDGMSASFKKTALYKCIEPNLESAEGGFQNGYDYDGPYNWWADGFFDYYYDDFHVDDVYEYSVTEQYASYQRLLNRAASECPTPWYNSYEEGNQDAMWRASCLSQPGCLPQVIKTPLYVNYRTRVGWDVMHGDEGDDGIMNTIMAGVDLSKVDVGALEAMTGVDLSGLDFGSMSLEDLKAVFDDGTDDDGDDYWEDSESRSYFDTFNTQGGIEQCLPLDFVADLAKTGFSYDKYMLENAQCMELNGNHRACQQRGCHSEDHSTYEYYGGVTTDAMDDEAVAIVNALGVDVDTLMADIDKSSMFHECSAHPAKHGVVGDRTTDDYDDDYWASLSDQHRKYQHLVSACHDVLSDDFEGKEALMEENQFQFYHYYDDDTTLPLRCGSTPGCSMQLIPLPKMFAHRIAQGFETYYEYYYDGSEDYDDFDASEKCGPARDGYFCTGGVTGNGHNELCLNSDVGNFLMRGYGDMLDDLAPVCACNMYDAGRLSAEGLAACAGCFDDGAMAPMRTLAKCPTWKELKEKSWSADNERGGFMECLPDNFKELSAQTGFSADNFDLKNLQCQVLDNQKGCEAADCDWIDNTQTNNNYKEYNGDADMIYCSASNKRHGIVGGAAPPSAKQRAAQKRLEQSTAAMAKACADDAASTACADATDAMEASLTALEAVVPKATFDAATGVSASLIAVAIAAAAAALL